jgi:hypothetical protein
VGLILNSSESSKSLKEITVTLSRLSSSNVECDKSSNAKIYK